jgi:N-carbamoyl-L-amino-acid hydrolase
MAPSGTAAIAVREDRLWQRHVDMAKLGSTPKGGVNRQALSAEDAAARNQLMGWARERGFAIFTDAIGNLFVRRDGTDPTALPVMSGSHMDSQPTGGDSTACMACWRPSRRWRRSRMPG